MRQQGQPYCHITISSGQGTVRYVVPVCQAKKEGHSKGAEERRKHGRGHSVIRGLDTAGQWFRRKSCKSPKRRESLESVTRDGQQMTKT